MNSGNLQQKSLWTRISHALLFCMNVLFFFLFFSLSFSAVFRNKSVYPCIFFIQLAAACAVTLLVFSAFVLFFLFKSRLPFAWERILQHETIFVAALFFLILTVQVVIVCSTYTSVGWDVAIVMEAATADVTYNHWDYFSVYPNNFLLFMLYRLVYSTLGKFLDIWLAMDLINILFVDAALLLGFFCAKKCFGRRTAYIVLGLSVLLFGFSPWVFWTRRTPLERAGGARALERRGNPPGSCQRYQGGAGKRISACLRFSNPPLSGRHFGRKLYPASRGK